METQQRLEALADAVASSLPDGLTVGLGSGSTAEAIVRAIGARVERGFRLTSVATSTRTAELASSLDIPLVELDEVDTIDLGIDGADEIDPGLNLVKGRGGALLFEKLVALACRDYLVVSTSEKLVERLGTRMPLPVEIVPIGSRHTIERLRAIGCNPDIRRAGDQPYVTDGAHWIVDCATQPIVDPVAFGTAIKGLTGVVEHGIFTGIAKRAMLVDESGRVFERLPVT